MLAEMSARPWQLGYFARTMAELHAAMHELVVPGLLSRREALRSSIAESSLLTTVRKELILASLEHLPDNNRLTHGDFRPDNIVMTASGPVIIDWVTARQGNPAQNVAKSSLLLSLAELPPGTCAGLRLLMGSARGLFNRLYLRRYFQLHPALRTEFAAWQLPTIAARLGDGIEPEQAKLMQLMHSLSTT